MIWKNTHCELLLQNGQALGVTAQGAVLRELVPRLPLSQSEVRPMFGASRQVLVLYADDKRYAAHIARIRDYMARGDIRCRFEDLDWRKDTDGKGQSLAHALVLLANADGDERAVHLSGRPAKGDFPVCLLLDVDEIEPSWTCNAFAFCIGDAIVDIRNPEAENTRTRWISPDRNPSPPSDSRSTGRRHDPATAPHAHPFFEGDTPCS